AFGSFANVVIHRLPRELSIAYPPSACPNPECGHPIRWYDNVPVLSYLLLRGRCRDCRTPISVRYPLIELTTAVLSLACLYLAVHRGYGVADLPGIAALWAFPFAFCFLLLAITFIDLAHWWVPPALAIPGTLLGLAANTLLGDLTGVSWLAALIGMVAGAAPILLVRWAYFRLRGHEGMGLGDALLMAMVGATLGWISLPFVLLASSVQGLLVAVPMTLMRRNAPPPWEQEAAGDAQPAPASDAQPEPAGDAQPAPASDAQPVPPVDDAPPAKPLGQTAVPFGPFIALGALEWLFFGDAIARWFFP
ncbi:MAG TPA: prepilin peptidase, partial [Myxococcota bacterium]|nr:prepilin peptidase [Myxococcota bacterium]